MDKIMIQKKKYLMVRYTYKMLYFIKDIFDISIYIYIINMIININICISN